MSDVQPEVTNVGPAMFSEPQVKAHIIIHIIIINYSENLRRGTGLN